jgi:hypothetical protein
VEIAKRGDALRTTFVLKIGLKKFLISTKKCHTEE